MNYRLAMITLQVVEFPPIRMSSFESSPDMISFQVSLEVYFDLNLTEDGDPGFDTYPHRVDKSFQKA